MLLHQAPGVTKIHGSVPWFPQQNNLLIVFVLHQAMNCPQWDGSSTWQGTEGTLSCECAWLPGCRECSRSQGAESWEFASSKNHFQSGCPILVVPLCHLQDWQYMEIDLPHWRWVICLSPVAAVIHRHWHRIYEEFYRGQSSCISACYIFP